MEGDSGVTLCRQPSCGPGHHLRPLRSVPHVRDAVEDSWVEHCRGPID
jgi:hypothetical protein